VLTDLPMGAWVMSALLDAADGPAAERAAGLPVTADVVAAVPTAAAGLNHWSDIAGPETRVGLVHAALNTTALSLHLASLVARARGRRPSGQAPAQPAHPADPDRDLLIAGIDELTPDDQRHVAALVESLRNRTRTS
jgi:hypothetical protein